MEWKEIKGFSGYKISDGGLVQSTKRKTPRILAPDVSNCGYHRVTLSQDGITKRLFIHRLVAEYFLLKEDGKDMVNHKNGDKLDNSSKNLEWVTCSENTNHAFDTGLRATGEDSANAQVSNEAVHKVCEKISEGLSVSEILGMGIHKNLTKSKIHDIKRRRCWKRISKHYKW